MSTGNATAMIASPDATPPTTTEDNEICISYTWRHALALELEKEQGEFPCPVATQGSHLIHPPPTPAFRNSVPSPSFTQTLKEQLETLSWKQDVRISCYGADFANEWLISQTPRDLAQEAAARIIRLQDEVLNSISETDTEDEREFERVSRRKMNCQLPSPACTKDDKICSPDNLLVRRKRKQGNYNLGSPAKKKRLVS
ncbi:hypothetical protein IWW34DRAFT_776029 [Fusarium oxysporum f. sp. albedinis]|nr:hypothetical protein IWW34DRAFT_776029 [Fusarium oxysporum f. sp. albedinis]KAK2470868.1 hypothetical protein H9L39_17099 [Fusarium oxysporum f. sp. albedinis]